MKELGELQKHHDAFASRKVRVMAISNDQPADAKATQQEFKDLAIVADTDQNLAKAVAVVHAGAALGGGDTNAPTTILLDGAGNVRWFFRPHRVIERLNAAEVLAAIDENLPKQ